MRVRFWQRTGARGALALRRSLKEDGINCYRLKNSGSRFYGREKDIIINWGFQQEIPRSAVRNGARIFNHPSAIINASNKLKTLTILHGSVDGDLSCRIPKFTEDTDIASGWIEDGLKVYCRTILSGHSGNGIVVASTLDELVDAPLYTQEIIGIQREIRVHVFNGKAIDAAQKRRMSSQRLEDEGITPNPLIKNLSNGFIFAREDFDCPEEARGIAIKAVKELGLDFGSVDMVLTDSGPVIIEVNTASGMTGKTVESYKNAIKDLGNNE